MDQFTEDYFNPKKNSKLSHLTNEQIDELSERYYNEKASLLVKEYSIDVNPSALIKILPPIVHKETLCFNCRVPLWTNRDSKTSSAYSWSKNYPYCPKCGHNTNPKHKCSCDACKEKAAREKRAIEEQRHKAEILKAEKLRNILLSNIPDPISFEDLSITQKIYLGAFLREAISEDYKIINSVNSFKIPLSPTGEYTDEIVKFLRASELIYIHPESKPSAFIEEGDYFKYNLLTVNWGLNIKSEFFSQNSLIDTLINPPKYSEEEAEEVQSLWSRVAFEESIEYFKYNVYSVFRVEYSVGKKTESVIKDLLEKFSTAQVFNIIYRGVTQASRFYQEQGVSRQHAVNAIVSNCQSYAERAVAKGWDITPYSRPKDYPQSLISKFLYDRIMQIGHLGFTTIPQQSKSKSIDSKDQEDMDMPIF